MAVREQSASELEEWTSRAVLQDLCTKETNLRGSSLADDANQCLASLRRADGVVRAPSAHQSWSPPDTRS